MGRSTSRGGNDSRQQQPRSYDRGRGSNPSRSWSDSNRSRSSSRGDTRSFSSRGDSRSFSRGDNNWRGGRSNPSFGNRQHFFARGRVERIVPFGGGFRIWIGGAPFPFFVPSAFYYRNHFRLGLTIGLGGYYNPLGYYDYYDGYDSGYYDNRGYSDGVLRGTVESVDYRRNTFVIRNEASGSFVTISMRQRLTEVRPGDYVELQGDWTRSGVFLAYTADLLNGGDQYRDNRDNPDNDQQYPR
ncbi:MAG: hypothetical protein ACXVJT_10740 [Thermoanaerobaculia bacterium]